MGGGKTVLEIGIGTGNLAARLLEKGCAVIGVDQSREMLLRAKAKLPDVELLEGNFLALPLEDGSVDTVATTYALHHLKEEEKRLAVAEMMRVAQPGGRIVIGDNMFADAAARELDRERLLSAGLQRVWDEIENGSGPNSVRLFGGLKIEVVQ